MYGLSGKVQSQSLASTSRCDDFVQATLTQASGRQPPRCLKVTNILKPWQIQRLEKASVQGRRNISIKELCGDLQLQRADVLQWLKDHQPVTDQSSRDSVEMGSTDEDCYSWGAGLRHANPAGASSQQQEMPKQRLRLPTKGIPDNTRKAPWAQSYGLKKLPKAAELTLEKIYSEWTHPPNTIIDSLWDLHQIPRRRALDWFAKRRVADAQGPLSPTAMSEDAAKKSEGGLGGRGV